MLDILFNLILCIMAIIHSLAIGKSVKSAGNLTYKTVRGRTIASQRIISNKSNTARQQNQREHFAKVSASMSLLQQYISACYEPSKFGSPRNAFFSRNKNFTLGGLVGEVAEGVVPLSDGMLSSLTAEPISQLSLLSNGSLPGFITIKYKKVANYKYGENTYDSIRVIEDLASGNYNEAFYTFTFAKPILYTDLKIYAFGFGDEGLMTGVGTIKDAGSISFDFGDSPLSQALALSRPYFAGDSNELIEKVDVNFNFSHLSKCPIAIAVPSVLGKVPTISGVFAKTSAV